MKIGYDYDGTLTRSAIAAKAFFDSTIKANTVYIITKRSSNPNDLEHGSKEVLEMADKLRIKPENVIFTDNGIKSPYINDLGIQVFYDDKEENIIDIKTNTQCQAIKV